MARPVHADANETRRRILDAAITEFAADGYHGASTRALAARAGVNISTLHHYFGGKQALYDAAVDEVYRRLGGRLRAAAAEASFDDLDDLVTRIYEAARQESAGVRVLVRQVLDAGRLTPHTEERHFLPRIDEMARLATLGLGLPPTAARPAVVAIGYLFSRFLIQDDASLVAAMGASSIEEAHALVATTLARTARALLAED